MSGTRAILELARELLGDYELHGAGAFKVIPVLVNDLAAHLPLLAEVLRHADGVLLSAPEFAEGTIGRRQESLAALIENTLRLPYLGGTELTVSISENSDGNVSALLSEQECLATNKGFQIVQGLLTSLFDARLHRTRLAALAYDETLLGVDSRAAVWDLLTTQLTEPGIAVGTLTWLIVFIGIESADYDRHCQKGVSARFRITADGKCLKRDSWEAAMTGIRQIAPSPSKHWVLFLGAGFSVSSKMPLGDTLRNEALSEFLGATGEATLDELARRFHAFIQEKGRLLPQEQDMPIDAFLKSLTLERVLREVKHQMGDLPRSRTIQDIIRRNSEVIKRPGSSVVELQEIIRSRETQAGGRLIVITLNFDTLIEDDQSEHVDVFATQAKFETCRDIVSEYLAQGGKVPVLKLHGSLDEPASIVANIDDTALGLDPVRADILRFLANASHPVPWIYVGCSMRDLDLETLLGDRWFAEHVDERWVGPFPEDAVAAFAQKHREAFWRWKGLPDYRERQINVTSDVFFREVSSILVGGRIFRPSFGGIRR